LIPMAHVGDAEFYRKISRSFPTNSIILMEGISDNKNLLTNRPTYQRMATSLGLAEQEKEFEPTQGELVDADVDVEQFSTNTIGFLNLALLVHAKGLNPGVMLQLLECSASPDDLEPLVEDVLRKRNRHLLEELQARLPQSKCIIVPWGAGHMPGIAEEIQKSGFRLSETQEYFVIRFRFTGHKGPDTGKK
jgi:hypothetical protein